MSEQTPSTTPEPIDPNSVGEFAESGQDPHEGFRTVFSKLGEIVNEPDFIDKASEYFTFALTNPDASTTPEERSSIFALLENQRKVQILAPKIQATDGMINEIVVVSERVRTDTVGYAERILRNTLSGANNLYAANFGTGVRDAVRFLNDSSHAFSDLLARQTDYATNMKNIREQSQQQSSDLADEDTELDRSKAVVEAGEPLEPTDKILDLQLTNKVARRIHEILLGSDKPLEAQIGRFFDGVVELGEAQVRDGLSFVQELTLEAMRRVGGDSTDIELREQLDDRLKVIAKKVNEMNTGETTEIDHQQKNSAVREIEGFRVDANIILVGDTDTLAMLKRNAVGKSDERNAQRENLRRSLAKTS